jgi:hypothetical protein
MFLKTLVNNFEEETWFSYNATKLTNLNKATTQTNPK